MHITVFCPHCQSRYQLDPSLRGKRMRCPNTICRMVFEVREESEAAPPPASKAEETPASVKKPVTTGSVGEVVPVLSAEAAPAEPALPETPTVKEPVQQWTAPPVRKPPVRKVEPPPSPARPKAPPQDDLFPGDLDIPGDDDDSADSSPEPAEAPREMRMGTWEPPPIRTRGTGVVDGGATGGPALQSVVAPVQPE